MPSVTVLHPLPSDWIAARSDGPGLRPTVVYWPDSERIHPGRHDPGRSPSDRYPSTTGRRNPPGQCKDSFMFQQMTTFVRIAEMGSITRAARSLGLSLSMASRQLSSLE